MQLKVSAACICFAISAPNAEVWAGKVKDNVVPKGCSCKKSSSGHSFNVLEGKVWQYEPILCVCDVLMQALMRKCVLQHIQRYALDRVRSRKVISADKAQVLHVEDS